MPSAPALAVFGRYLLRLGARHDHQVLVLVVELRPAPRGRLADLGVLMGGTAEVLGSRLGGCDLVSRLGPRELAVLLLSPGPCPEAAIDQVRAALVDAGLGSYTQLGLARQEPRAAGGLDALLLAARLGKRPVWQMASPTPVPG